MDKKNFLEDIHNSIIKNRRKKILTSLISISLVIFLLFFSYSFFSNLFSNVGLNRKISQGIENSFLYSNIKKAHLMTKQESVKFFSYSFIIKNEEIIDKEQWDLFLK